MPHSMVLVMAAAVFLPLVVTAETITIGGVVRDKNSLAPIPSARVDITETAGQPSPITVYTSSAGEWQLTIVTTASENPPALPDEPVLLQNYPNPFNPSTRIGFLVPAAGAVRFRAVTLLGQVLDEREWSLLPGVYEVTWTSKGSAGVVLYELELGGRRIVRKMLQMDGGSGGGWGEVHITGGRMMPSQRAKAAAGEYKINVRKTAYESDSTTVIAVDGARADVMLESVHSRALVADLHNDVLDFVTAGYQLGARHTYNHSDLPRWRDGGVDLQVLAVYVSSSLSPPLYFQYANRMIDSFVVQVSRNSAVFGAAATAAEAESLAARGKLAGVLGLEGGHAIENDISKLRALHNRGIRYMTITWNNSTSWAVSAQDPRSASIGLSEFGRQVIRTMDSVGMIIDVSHVGIKTIEDILSTTANPIIASHSGARALRDHYRNLSDGQIRAIAQRGGVIGVVFYPTFLSVTGNATIDSVVLHIDHIKSLVGVDHVALGSDFDGIGTVPTGLEDVSRYPALTQALFDRGYTNEEVKKILGLNFLRVFRTVCR